MRRAHILRPNRGAGLPTLMIGIDTETDSIPIASGVVEARLRFGWLAVTRRHRGLRWTPPRWTRFTTPSEAWDAIEAIGWDHGRCVLVAHNVGFDFRVLDGFRQLRGRGWALRRSVIEDPPTILRWARGRRSLLVLDTLNYHRSSLAVLGANLGLDKLAMPPLADSPGSWDAYCRRDVEIVVGAMQELCSRVRRWDLGHLAPTIAGQAFTAWRHRHMTSPILIDANPDGLALARAGFYGGRTEAYRLGSIGEPVTVYDVNSLYPSVMASEPMPTRLRSVYRRVTPGDLAEIVGGAAVMADVELSTETADYPLVIEGRLCFPVGSFRTVLPTPEIMHALASGHVTRVHRAAVYDRAPIFASYVREWWLRRRAAVASGDVADTYYCKLMMNALFGKFGQRGDVYERVGDAADDAARTWIEIDAQTRHVTHYRSLAGHLSARTGEAESRDSHPAIAAHVTSAGRMALLALCEAAGRPATVYADTDSLFVVGPAAAAVLDGLTGPGLGQLKRERVLTGLVIHGLKDYEADGYRRTKGIRSSAVAIAPGVWEQDTFVGLKGAVASGDVDRQVIRRTTKHLARLYVKGDVGPAGLVSPYRLG